MKAYNETLVRNRYAQKMAEKWHSEGMLTDGQLAEAQLIHAAVPYDPNLFIKIGLFVFALACFFFGGSFVILLVGEGNGLSISITSFLYAIGVAFLLVHIIQTKQLHFSGIDNALIYGVIGATMPLIFQLYESLNISELWIGVALCLPVLVLVVYSFGEPLVALGTFLCILFIVASVLMKNPIGKALLPFALMAVAAVFFMITRKLGQKQTAFYWKEAIAWVNTAALAVFYATGNYFVVREVNAELNKLRAPSPEIAFAGLFWGFTFLIPVLYLYGGFRWRNRTLLLLGLLGLVASVLTYRQYHAVLPLEWGLLLGGALVTVCAFVLIRGLKTPKYGFSYAPEPDGDERRALEMAVVSQMTKNMHSTDNGVEFGGGDFAGGGAGEKY
ncbi:hypothetical protein [Runella slithyformis]|uniref:DUF2157 domain-containing protein n=1 Tax=Runella slithyformis (strain ATCC 29530 / DSM 19594 / LMG 11500 / NCIMB 11436 / LSU 4) TaxID=761193 RepID=A0A7U3ZP36_RUNSL|nr:hypothetical protein [Runella slithyformis]AEI50765.1 hypothetical protein Runsl_4439 [Runella slithyformis DSM 19594]